jgi:FixJ family two-component response regulator
MPGMSGLELQSRLGESKVDLPVIILSGHGDVPMAVEAMKAGAVDFIEKPFRDQVLLDAVNGALRKAIMKRKSLARQLEYERQRKMLTSREQEVLDLLLAGKTTKEIATLLGISTKTVDYHRLHVFDKLGVDTVVELVRMAEGH